MAMPPIKPALDIEPALFEAVVKVGKLLGLNKSASLALALLFAADQPLSLDDITASTGIAKSSNSVILKNLEQMGLVESVNRPHDRRKYYRVVDNPAEAFAVLIAQRLDNVAGRQQELFDSDHPNHSAAYRQRLVQLKAIYLGLLQAANYLRIQRANAWHEMNTRLAVDESHH